MALLLNLIVVNAMAMPNDFTVLADAEGCVVSIGPTRTDAPRQVRSDCTWPEASLASARALLTDFTSYPRFIPNVRSATVLRTEPQGTLVHQEHDIPLFADREVQLWMQVADREQGGFIVTWRKADEPFQPAKGHAPVKFNEGMWEVWPAAEGGIHLVHEVAYEPGVRVPDWLIRRYRTTGISTVMRELRALIGGAGTVP